MKKVIQSPPPALLGRVVRSVRRAQALTQADLALAAGVSTPFLSALENGKLTVRLDVLVRVLDALNISMNLSLPDDLHGLDLQALATDSDPL